MQPDVRNAMNMACTKMKWECVDHPSSNSPTDEFGIKQRAAGQTPSCSRGSEGRPPDGASKLFPLLTEAGLPGKQNIVPTEVRETNPRVNPELPGRRRHVPTEVRSGTIYWLIKKN